MAAAAPARKAAPAPHPAHRKAKARAGARRQGAARAKASRRRPKMTIYRSRPGPLAPDGAIPVAVGRTAVAVRDLPDSNLVVRMTRGRAWIAVLGTLLVGIVALNVVSLGLNATSGRTSQEITSLERENSSIRAGIAEKLSSGRVEAAAANLGLYVPDPSDITYMTASEGDVERAAEVLARGIDPSSGATTSTPTAAAPSGPSAPAPTVPAPSAPAPTAPTPQPTTPSGSGGTAGGGISPG